MRPGDAAAEAAPPSVRSLPRDAAAAAAARSAPDTYAQALDKVRCGERRRLGRPVQESDRREARRLGAARSSSAKVLLKLDRQGEATIQANKAAQLAPDKAGPLVTLTDIYIARGLADKAADAIAKAAAARSRTTPRCSERAAAVAASAGKIDEAIALNEKVIAAEARQHARSWSLWPTCYNRNKQPKREPKRRSTRSWRSIRRTRTGRSTTWASSSRTATTRPDADHRKAIEAFRKAIDLKPDYALAHRDLGFALLRTGDLTGARKELQEYVDLEPNARRTPPTSRRTIRASSRRSRRARDGSPLAPRRRRRRSASCVARRSSVAAVAHAFSTRIAFGRIDFDRRPGGRARRSIAARSSDRGRARLGAARRSSDRCTARVIVERLRGPRLTASGGRRGDPVGACAMAQAPVPAVRTADCVRAPRSIARRRPWRPSTPGGGAAAGIGARAPSRGSPPTASTPATALVALGPSDSRVLLRSRGRGRLALAAGVRDRRRGSRRREPRQAARRSISTPRSRRSCVAAGVSRRRFTPRRCAPAAATTCSSPSGREGRAAGRLSGGGRSGRRSLTRSRALRHNPGFRPAPCSRAWGFVDRASASSRVGSMRSLPRWFSAASPSQGAPPAAGELPPADDPVRADLRGLLFPDDPARRDSVRRSTRSCWTRSSPATRSVCAGGIHATVVGVTDATVQVRIADQVRVDVEKASITTVKRPE